MPHPSIKNVWNQKDVCKTKQRSREIESNVIVGAKAVADFTMLVWRVVHVM